MPPQPSVLIVRDDGVIVVPDAVPVSRDWAAGLDALADSLGAPRPRDETPADGAEPGTMSA